MESERGNNEYRLGLLPEGRYHDGVYEWVKDEDGWHPLRAPMGMAHPWARRLRRVTTAHHPINWKALALPEGWLRFAPEYGPPTAVYHQEGELYDGEPRKGRAAHWVGRVGEDIYLAELLTPIGSKASAQDVDQAALAIYSSINGHLDLNGWPKWVKELDRVGFRKAAILVMEIAGVELPKNPLIIELPKEED